MDFKEHAETAWQNTLKFIGPVLILTLVQVVGKISGIGGVVCEFQASVACSYFISEFTTVARSIFKH